MDNKDSAASEGVPKSIWITRSQWGLHTLVNAPTNGNWTEYVPYDTEMLLAIQQLTKARAAAGHHEDEGEVCRDDCEGCNDPVGQILREYSELRNSHKGVRSDSPSVDEATIWRLAKAITYFEEGHCFTDCPEHWTKSVAEIISKELKNSDSGKVGSTPLADVEGVLAAETDGQSSLLPASEMIDRDLVALALESHTRALMYPDSKVQHDRANECHDELLKRLTRASDASKEAPKVYHCSCGAACTADEYIDHLFRGHDAQVTDASADNSALGERVNKVIKEIRQQQTRPVSFWTDDLIQLIRDLHKYHGTEQTMHQAWRKRAEEAEADASKEYVRGLSDAADIAKTAFASDSRHHKCGSAVAALISQQETK